uniref:Ovule protein n=1 Tax=Strongyloides papillosus TaxID=174720 RepID=A0A0N5B350_STREA
MNRNKCREISLSARSRINRKIHKISTISAPQIKRRGGSFSARSLLDNQNDLVSLLSATSLSSRPSFAVPAPKLTVNGNIYKKRQSSSISFSHFSHRHSVM